MRITAKFDGQCAECGRRTVKGDEIEYVNRKAYHPECITVDEESEPSDSQYALADKLGFKRMKAEAL